MKYAQYLVGNSRVEAEVLDSSTERWTTPPYILIYKVPSYKPEHEKKKKKTAIQGPRHPILISSLPHPSSSPSDSQLFSPLTAYLS
jgi:hypothetical protein